jgi:hypothetical protein
LARRACLPAQNHFRHRQEHQQQHQQQQHHHHHYQKHQQQTSSLNDPLLIPRFISLAAVMLIEDRKLMASCLTERRELGAMGLLTPNSLLSSRGRSC